MQHNGARLAFDHAHVGTRASCVRYCIRLCRVRVSQASTNNGHRHAAMRVRLCDDRCGIGRGISYVATVAAFMPQRRIRRGASHHYMTT